MTERRVRAYVGLGANLGDAEATLAAAIGALADLPGVRLRGVSRLYATAPVGVTDQPEFRNAAVALDVPAGRMPPTGALALLGRLKGLERAFGRRPRRRWGPRELDLDLLVFGRARLAIERSRRLALGSTPALDPVKAAKLLEVPHPRAAARLFVLAPLADLAPGLVPPGWGDVGRIGQAPPGRDRGSGGGPRRSRAWDAPAGRLAPGSAQVARRQLGLDRLAGRPADDPVAARRRPRRDDLDQVAIAEDERGPVVGLRSRRPGSPGR